MPPCYPLVVPTQTRANRLEERFGTRADRHGSVIAQESGAIVSSARRNRAVPQTYPPHFLYNANSLTRHPQFARSRNRCYRKAQAQLECAELSRSPFTRQSGIEGLRAGKPAHLRRHCHDDNRGLTSTTLLLLQTFANLIIFARDNIPKSWQNRDLCCCCTFRIFIFETGRPEQVWTPMRTYVSVWLQMWWPPGTRAE